MSKFLRGKKTGLKNFTENFIKVPNIILHAHGLTAVDKLILIELQSYATRLEFVLAYTRLANDLQIDKSNQALESTWILILYWRDGFSETHKGFDNVQQLADFLKDNQELATAIGYIPKTKKQ